MEIQQLRLKNFGVHEDLELDFRPGINGIVGPNGSGKSTVLEALRFVNTGQISTPGNLADNVSWGQASGSVYEKFKHGDTVYELTRNLGKSKSPPELKFDGQVVRKADEVERFLNKLMQTSTEALINNVFVAQGQIDQILFSTNGERLREIQQTVGLHRCADAEKAITVELGRYQITIGLREQLESTATQAGHADVEYMTATTVYAGVQQQIEKLIPAERQLVKWLADKQTQQLIAQADQDVQTSVDANILAKTQSDQADRDVHVTTTTVAHLKPAAEQAERDKLAKQTTQKARELRQSLTTQRDGLVKSVAEYVGVPTPEAVQQLEQARQVLATSVTLREDQLAGRAPRPKLPKELELAAQLTEVQTRLAVNKRREIHDDERQAQSSIKELQHKLQLFGEGKCPTCTQPVHGVHGLDPVEMEAELKTVQETFRTLSDSRAAAFNSQHQADEQLCTELNAQLHRLDNAAHEALKRLCAEVRQKATDAGEAAQTARDRRRAFEQLENRLQAVDQQLVQLGTDSEDVPISLEELTAQIEVYRQAQTRLQDAIGTQRLKHQALSQTEDQLQKARARRQAFHHSGGLPTEEQLQAAQRDVEQLRVKQAELRRVNDQMIQAETRLSHLKEMRVRLEQQLAREAKDAAWAAVCRRARDILHVSGLPSLLMREYAKVLNKRMAYYLEVWESEFSFVLNDDLEFIVTYPNGCTHAGGRLSGGQKIVASTAFRLAMADTFARQVGLLVLDEPSNYLDKDNIVHLQNLLLKLKDLSGHTGKQILLVTHEEQLVGFFDHHISLYR